MTQTLLIEIIVTIVAAALSLPIFPYLVFKNVLRDEEGYEEDNVDYISISGLVLYLVLGMIALISILCSILIFEIAKGQNTWYVYLLTMAEPIFVQALYALSMMKKEFWKIVYPILGILFLVCIAFPVRDSILTYEPKQEEVVDLIIDTPEPILSSEQIKARLGATWVSNPIYSKNDEKYFYEVELKGKKGIVIVDEEHLQFIGCNYGKDVDTLKENKEFRSQQIVELGIELRDGIPYAKFGILKRPGVFSRPVKDYEVLLNMKTGKVTKK